MVCISKLLSRSKYVLPNNPHNLVEQSSCDSTCRSFIYDHTRTVCESLLLNLRDFYFQQVNQQLYQWQNVDNKVQKATLNAAPDELVEKFNVQIQTLNKPISENGILVQVYFSENYSNKEQQEIQSIYFGHETFHIFTACCYFHGNDGKLKTRNVTVTLEATDHSRIAEHT